MKNHLFLLVSLLFIIHVQAQKEAAIWYFGNNAGLDFNSGAPVPLTDGALVTDEGCAVISDTFGNLLFYTDGMYVWNRNHQLMPNGTGLLGDPSSSQSAIVIPQPGSSSIFYVFTVDKEGRANGLNYSVVDLTLNGGLGDLTTKNVQLHTPVSEKLTAVKHANGTDIWVVTHGWENTNFMAYLVTPTGIQTTPVISTIGAIHEFPRNVGCLKASPDGTKMAIGLGLYAAELYDFDDGTGFLSNMQVLRNTPLDRYYGVEFSPNGQFVYVSTWNGLLFQYDITNANPASTEQELFNDPAVLIGTLQLGIDGKIYAAIAFENYINVIENPNNAGLACNYIEQAIDLNGRESMIGLPPFIQSVFLVDINARNLCLGDTTEFSTQADGTITSINWDFGDGNTSALEEPTHIYAAPGDYTVSVNVVTTTESKTETKDITIYNTPIANTAIDYEVCTPNTTYSFDLSTKNAEILGTQLAADNTITYHPTLVDAQNGTNVLPALYTNTLATETIFARISNINNGSCNAISSFDIVVKEAPALHTVTDWIVCDTDTDGLFSFNLTTKDAEVLNGQDPTTFGVSYFESQADADANTNVLAANYTNTSSPQQLFYRIQNSTYPECYKTGSFNIEVITSVTANTPTDMEVCDIDNDGFSIFNLSNQDAEILGGQSAANYTISYHETQADADANTNTINATAYTNTLAYSQTIYARVENNGNIDCYNTTSFTITVSDTPVLQNVLDWQVCDDNNDGFSTFTLTDKNSEVLGIQSTANFSVSYYIQLTDAESSQNAILGDFVNTVNPQTVYYRIENNANAMCSVVGAFNLQVYDVPVANIPTPFITCDLEETGIQIFDLSLKDVEVLNGQDSNLYEINYFTTQIDAEANLNALSKQAYTNTLPQEIIYTRIQNINLEDCYATTGFQIIINALPLPSLEETYVICPDSPELVIDGGAFESWSWWNEAGDEIGTLQNINITDLGDYTLTVRLTQNGVTCEKTVSFEVVSSGAPEAFTTEIEGFSDTISLEVNATGIGQFEYSIDGENFQDSNRFKVFPGEYTVHVRDAFLCRTLSKEIVALGYQKFFTPNGDNTNEYWNIIGIENEPNSQLFIYDRYGKLLAQISPTSRGWDGTFNGKKMLASDYWFKYVYGNGKVAKGHFALKR